MSVLYQSTSEPNMFWKSFAGIIQSKDATLAGINLWGAGYTLNVRFVRGKRTLGHRGRQTQNGMTNCQIRVRDILKTYCSSEWHHTLPWLPAVSIALSHLNEKWNSKYQRSGIKSWDTSQLSPSLAIMLAFATLSQTQVSADDG